ncbi:MAG: S-layer homology domain-containing protein [Oscillospiraceae bacterium]|nr:S-layer homology domain-containing protein [Oscillospiraceae bacterium]
MKLKKTNYKLLAIAVTAALLLPLLAFAGVGAGVLWAASEEITVYVPAGAQSFEIELSVQVGAQPFAGIEFGLEIRDEGVLEFNSFEKGTAYSESLNAPTVLSNGVHYFGFLSNENDFAGGWIAPGTLKFGGYTSDREVTIVLSEVNVVRITEDRKTTKEANTDVISYKVRRGAPGEGEPTPTPTPSPEVPVEPTPTPTSSPTGGGSNAGNSVRQSPAPTQPPVEDNPEEPTLINDQPTPLGLSFLKDHIQFIIGYPDGTVQPEANITRAETVTIFYRLIDDDAKSEPAPSAFQDVPADEWYAPYVSYAAMKGIVLGYPDGGFHPDDQITRAEFATIMSRFVPETPTPATSEFADVPADHWAIQYISTCYANGWVIGYPDGTFMPESPITRAEAVTILNRALGRGIAPEGIPSGAPSFSDLPEDHWAYAQILEASVTHVYAPNQNE